MELLLFILITSQISISVVMHALISCKTQHCDKWSLRNRWTIKSYDL